MDFLQLVPNLLLIAFWAFLVHRADARTKAAMTLVRLQDERLQSGKEMIERLVKAGDDLGKEFARYRDNTREYDRLREDFPDSEIRQILVDCKGVIEQSPTVGTLRVLIDRGLTVLDGNATTQHLDDLGIQLAVLRDVDGMPLVWLRHEERWINLEDGANTMVFKEHVCIGTDESKIPTLRPLAKQGALYPTSRVSRKLEL